MFTKSLAILTECLIDMTKFWAELAKMLANLSNVGLVSLKTWLLRLKYRLFCQDNDCQDGNPRL